MTFDVLSDHEPAGPQTYAYKPSLLGAPWEFRLTDEGFGWQKGRLSGRIPYRDIHRVRLSYRPVTLQTHRFIAEIWSAGMPRIVISSSSWRSLVEQERFDGPYSGFIRDLHRRILEAGAKPSFEAGSPRFLYWPGIVMFGLIALGLAALTVRALQEGSLAAAALIGGLLGLFLWQTGSFFQRNYPGSYDPEAIPERVLPRSERTQVRTTSTEHRA